MALDEIDDIKPKYLSDLDPPYMKLRLEGGLTFAQTKISDAATGKVIPVGELHLDISPDSITMARITVPLDELDLYPVVTAVNMITLEEFYPEPERTVIRAHRESLATALILLRERRKEEERTAKEKRRTAKAVEGDQVMELDLSHESLWEHDNH